MTALTHASNPILWQETTHQDRTSPRWTRRGPLTAIAAGMLLIGIIIALALSTEGIPAVQLGLFIIWILQATTALRGILAGANAISREHVGQMWDALVLTGVSARHILFGKWRAALHSVRGWMLLLGFFHLAMLPMFPAVSAKIIASFYARYNYSNSSYYSNIEMTWVPWAWFLSVFVVLLMTFLEVLCSTALGLALSALTRRGVIAGILAIGVRFFPVILFSAYLRFEYGPTYIWRLWGRTEFALSDSGTAATLLLTMPLTLRMPRIYTDVLPGLLLASMMLIALLGASLLTAWIMIRRTGALPQPRSVARPSGWGLTR